MNQVTHTSIVNFIWDTRSIADMVTGQVDVRGISILGTAEEEFPGTADELNALDDEETEGEA